MKKLPLSKVPVFERINSYQNELLLRGQFGTAPGLSKKDPVSEPIHPHEYDTLEPETEYAQIMRIIIEDKLE